MTGQGCDSKVQSVSLAEKKEVAKPHITYKWQQLLVTASRAKLSTADAKLYVCFNPTVTMVIAFVKMSKLHKYFIYIMVKETDFLFCAQEKKKVWVAFFSFFQTLCLLLHLVVFSTVELSYVDKSCQLSIGFPNFTPLVKTKSRKSLQVGTTTFL